VLLRVLNYQCAVEGRNEVLLQQLVCRVQSLVQQQRRNRILLQQQRRNKVLLQQQRRTRLSPVTVEPIKLITSSIKNE